MKLSIVNFNTLGVAVAPWTVKKSFNLRQRFLRISKEIDASSADVVALQEVISYVHVRFIRKHVKKTYPFIYFKRGSFGPVGGLIFLSKLPFDSVSFIPFRKKGSFFNMSVVTKLFRAGMLVCTVKDEPISLINAHLSPNIDSNWHPDNRFVPFVSSQLEQLALEIDQLHKAGNAIILAGDLNTAKDSFLYKMFVERAELNDVFENDLHPTMHAELSRRGLQPRRLDYIFTRNAKKAATSIKADYLFTEKVTFSSGKTDFLSDHIGLFATVEFKEKD